MNNLGLTCIKIVLSIPIGVGLAYPFLEKEAGRGILSEVQLLGAVCSALAIAVFVVLVFLYASDLKRSLALVSTSSRSANPNSVWLMFLLPYNFIEDFFIVSNVARSLRAEARINPALASFRSFGLLSGIGWCAMQVISLIPNQAGLVAGLAAIPLWIWHWFFVKRANLALERGMHANNSSKPTPLHGEA